MPPANTGNKVREQARLTLHEADPITDNEDTLSLFYEYYRGYTSSDSVKSDTCPKRSLYG